MADPNGRDTNGSGPSSGPARSPSETLAVAGNELRLSILRALFEAESGLGYADLMDRVDVLDSGRFNYHLTKLVGPFVRKRDDRYELRHAGAQIVGAVLAGTYDDDRELGPVVVDGGCNVCGGHLLARYEADWATIACEQCETVVTRDSVPPGVFEGYDESDLPTVLARWVRHGFARAVDGFCPVCAGRTDTTLGSHDHEALDRLGVSVACRRCGMAFTGALGSVLLDHPAVVSFYYDHGLDVRAVPLWDLAWLQGEGEELVAEDPPAARVALDLDDERLTVTLDADLVVQSVERTAASQ